MKKIVFLFGCLILLGPGCSSEGTTSTTPYGFVKYSKNGLSFVYPEQLTINDNYHDGEGYDWNSNILIKNTNIETEERSCYEGFKERYANTASDKPLTKALIKLKNEGLTINNYFELVGLDVASCNTSFGWSSLRAMPLNVDGVNGMVSYGVAGTDLGGPDLAWIVYTGVDRDDNVYLITLRPIFGKLADRDLKSNMKVGDDFEKAAQAIKSSLEHGRKGLVYADDKNNAAYWADDLIDNINILNQILSTVSYRPRN